MLSVKVTGAKELQRSIERLGKAFTKEHAEDDLMRAVQPTVQAAESNITLGPPSIHLKENVGAAPSPDAARRNGWLAAVAIGAFRVAKIGEIFYGSFLELGTVKQIASPWLRPAFDATRDAVVKRLASLAQGRVIAAVKR